MLKGLSSAIYTAERGKRRGKACTALHIRVTLMVYREDKYHSGHKQRNRCPVATRVFGAMGNLVITPPFEEPSDSM
jgi:hypothetical protein